MVSPPPLQLLSARRYGYVATLQEHGWEQRAPHLRNDPARRRGEGGEDFEWILVAAMEEEEGGAGAVRVVGGQGGEFTRQLAHRAKRREGSQEGVRSLGLSRH